MELPEDFIDEVPSGFELLDLPPCNMMFFQGPPFEQEKFKDAIREMQTMMKMYDPTTNGYQWADEDAPRIQPAPMGFRGVY